MKRAEKRQYQWRCIKVMLLQVKIRKIVFVFFFYRGGDEGQGERERES